MAKTNDELEKYIDDVERMVKKVDQERYEGDAALKRMIQQIAEDTKKIKKHLGIED